MVEPVFGLSFRRENVEPRPAILADMDTAGIVGPMPDADPTVFPLDTPVKLYSNDHQMIAKMGAGGFIPDAIRGINDQLGELQLAAQVIVVRTPEGASADPTIKLQQTIAAIMGDSTAGTGIHAFLKAPDLVAATPRLIMAPGYTSLLATGVESLDYAVAGAGYTPGARLPITFAGGGANAVQAVGYVDVGSDGVPGDPVLESPGAFYSSTPTASLPAPGAGGTQATLNVTTATLANPIVAALPVVLNQLLAHAVVESANTSETENDNWRETINHERIIPVAGGVKVMDPNTAGIVVRPFAPRVIGAMIRRDHEKGGLPFHSAANQPIYGILGPARTVKFVLTDGANEGQQTLAKNVGILARGEIGNDFAIASGGFVFIGTDNAGEDEVWRFYNQTRGRDFIHITLLRVMRWYLGRHNITGNTLTAVMNSMKNLLRDLKADENILDFRVMFRGSLNSAEQIRLGNVSISFMAEEPAPLRKITTYSGRYRPAVDALVAQLEAQMNMAA